MFRHEWNKVATLNRLKPTKSTFILYEQRIKLQEKLTSIIYFSKQHHNLNVGLNFCIFVLWLYFLITEACLGGYWTDYNFQRDFRCRCHCCIFSTNLMAQRLNQPSSQVKYCNTEANQFNDLAFQITYVEFNICTEFRFCSTTNY